MVRTDFATVSESPIMVNERLGRVIATGFCVSVVFGGFCCEVLPFSRRLSPRKPTSWSGLLLTRLTIITSFSLPLSAN